MIVRGDIKKYIGAVESEEIAARFYDKYSLIIQGFEVRYCAKIDMAFAFMHTSEIHLVIILGQNKLFVHSA